MKPLIFLVLGVVGCGARPSLQYLVTAPVYEQLSADQDGVDQAYTLDVDANDGSYHLVDAYLEAGGRRLSVIFDRNHCEQYIDNATTQLHYRNSGAGFSCDRWSGLLTSTESTFPTFAVDITAYCEEPEHFAVKLVGAVWGVEAGATK